MAIDITNEVKFEPIFENDRQNILVLVWHNNKLAGLIWPNGFPLSLSKYQIFRKDNKYEIEIKDGYTYP